MICPQTVRKNIEINSLKIEIQVLTMKTILARQDVNLHVVRISHKKATMKVCIFPRWLPMGAHCTGT